MTSTLNHNHQSVRSSKRSLLSAQTVSAQALSLPHSLEREPSSLRAILHRSSIRSTVVTDTSQRQLPRESNPILIALALFSGLRFLKQIVRRLTPRSMSKSGPHQRAAKQDKDRSVI